VANLSSKRVLAITNFSQDHACIENLVSKKDCFGVTPKPARETHALPKSARLAVAPYLRAFLEGRRFPRKCATKTKSRHAFKA
jgi:hypothetical protein